MDPSTWILSFARNLPIQMLMFGFVVVLLHLSYVNFLSVSLKDDLILGRNPCIHASSSSSSSTSTLDDDHSTSKEWQRTSSFYSAVFQDHIIQGILRPNSKALCLHEATEGQDVFALKQLGVLNSISISDKAAFPPLVHFSSLLDLSFLNDTFDYIFSDLGILDAYISPFNLSSEIARSLKTNGFVVVHTKSAQDSYSLNSFIRLFDCCTLVWSRKRFPSSLLSVHEIVLRKQGKCKKFIRGNECVVSSYKQELIEKAEPLIMKEPLKPWITFKKNMKKINYLPSIVDISFKRRYVYVDVGARSYSSSIGGWFRKQYPKQNRTFEIFAIESDKAFHEEYKTKKGVKLLPYSAWVRNETLFFEIRREPSHTVDKRGKGMGRIRPSYSSISFAGDKIRGFDFANWLKTTVSERDFVVVKMDVEGTEFELIPRLFETGAICLIDEMFLECHYNRWLKCCSDKRNSKYQKTYEKCLALFSSLRSSGVLVHQWL